MPLAGRQLSYRWALALSYHVGFRYGKGLAKAVAIMTAESGRYVEAYNDANVNGSTDRGLFQINSIHDSQISPAEAFKAIPNAEYAFKLSKEGSDFNPWYAFRNKKHLLYMPIVGALRLLLFRTNGLPLTKIAHVEEELG